MVRPKPWPSGILVADSCGPTGAVVSFMTGLVADQHEAGRVTSEQDRPMASSSRSTVEPSTLRRTATADARSVTSRIGRDLSYSLTRQPRTHARTLRPVLAASDEVIQRLQDSLGRLHRPGGGEQRHKIRDVRFCYSHSDYHLASPVRVRRDQPVMREGQYCWTRFSITWIIG